MSVEVKQKGEITQVMVGEELTIYTAAEIKSTLVGLLQEHSQLELDLSTVEELDSAGLQILLLLKLESQRLQKQFHIVRHSEAVIAVLEMLNLVLFFGDPVIIPAKRKRETS